jgi:hypothetical protein
MHKLTDLTLYANTEYDTVAEFIENQQESVGYATHLRALMLVDVIKHASFEQVLLLQNGSFTVMKGRNRFGYLSIKTVRLLRSTAPEVILVQGLVYPIQVMLLRLFLGGKPVFIAQHHGEKPFAGLKGSLQKFADRFIHAYVFTSMGNARGVYKLCKAG